MTGQKKEVPSYDEITIMINNIKNQRDRALAAACYWSGRRIQEVLNLDRKRDIISRKTTDGKETLLVNFKISKKKKEVYIKTPFPLDNEIASNFTNWIKHCEKYFTNTKIFDITSARAWQIMTDIDPEITDHWWRHVRASHLGTVMGPMELCAYFGWTDIKMALRYTHSNPDNVLSKMEQL